MKLGIGSITLILGSLAISAVQSNPLFFPGGSASTSEQVRPSYGLPKPSYGPPAPSYNPAPAYHGPPGRVGPVYTFVKTDPQANFKWGVRHRAGAQYGR